MKNLTSHNNACNIKTDVNVDEGSIVFCSTDEDDDNDGDDDGPFERGGLA